MRYELNNTTKFYLTSEGNIIIFKLPNVSEYNIVLIFPH